MTGNIKLEGRFGDLFEDMENQGHLDIFKAFSGCQNFFGSFLGVLSFFENSELSKKLSFFWVPSFSRVPRWFRAL